MRFGSLFSGIGGLDLGLERAGMTCAWQVEIDDYATRVLTKHWPDVPKFRDVRDCGDHNLEEVDLICGGFPCQDVSLAGQRAGLDGKRTTLWSEFARIIRELRPQWVVAENVPGLLSSDAGQFFGDILRDMAQSGYDVEWNCIPAAAFGAPHLRYRVILVANCNGKRIERIIKGQIQWVEEFSWFQNVRGLADLRDRPDIPEPLIRRKSNGLSSRMDRLGNAVVPQVAEWIGRRIMHSGEVADGN